MARARCVQCNRGNGAQARKGLCLDCWEEARPVVDGVTIRALREQLNIPPAEAAGAVGLPDAKAWVDRVEDADHEPDYAKAVIAVLEALHEEKQRAGAPAPQPSRAPVGSVAADLVAERTT